MIYCVIPRELEAELYEKMVEFYKDNPNVTVILDRRDGPDRRAAQDDGSFRERRKVSMTSPVDGFSDSKVAVAMRRS